MNKIVLFNIIVLLGVWIHGCSSKTFNIINSTAINHVKPPTAAPESKSIYYVYPETDLESRIGKSENETMSQENKKKNCFVIVYENNEYIKFTESLEEVQMSGKDVKGVYCDDDEIANRILSQATLASLIGG